MNVTLLRRMLIHASMGGAYLLGSAISADELKTGSDQPAIGQATDAPKETPAGKSFFGNFIRAFVAPATPAPVPRAAVAPKSEAPVDDASSTHTFRRHIKILGTDGATKLQTFCLDGQGRILALVAPHRSFSSPSHKGFGEIHLIEPDGTPVMHWRVDFHAQSINTGPDGSIFVGGDGHLACFDPDGKLLKTVELPHIAEAMKDSGALKQRAQAQLEATAKSRTLMIAQYKKQIDTIQAKPEEKRSKSDQALLKQLEAIVKQFEGPDSPYAAQSVDSIVASLVTRMRIINSVAVSDEDVFIVCGENQGYGFAIWRMDHEFKNPKMILGKLSGCCGQMDVQVSGKDLLIAQNTGHQFGRFDRDGKELGHWGQRTTGAAPGCFGGCCNPMNVRASRSGDIYTAESEGIVKRFSDKGEYLDSVGRVPLTGGCKNVAVAVSADAQQVFFCDQPGSQIIVMTQKPAKSETSETEAEATLGDAPAKTGASE